MSTIRRILVAVADPGARNQPAVTKGVRLARRLGAEVEVMHGLFDPQVQGELVYGSRIMEKDVRARIEAARRRLERRVQALAGDDITLDQRLAIRLASANAMRVGIDIVDTVFHLAGGGALYDQSPLQRCWRDLHAGSCHIYFSDNHVAKGGKVLHFPSVLGADVVTYNLPEVTTALRFAPDVLADIFLGRITKWNDARIAAQNAGVTLPSRDILVVHRSDGSGTTYIWTDYLATVSPAWAEGPGRGKTVQWPVGLGGKGNEGVAGQVKQTPGSIGYVELAYARQNRLPAGCR